MQQLPKHLPAQKSRTDPETRIRKAKPPPNWRTKLPMSLPHPLRSFTQQTHFPLTACLDCQGSIPKVLKKWTGLSQFGYTRALKTSTHNTGSPFLSTHVWQIQITAPQLGQFAIFTKSLKSKLSWAPTCLSISSPSTRIDWTFLGSEQTVVLPTHNLHINKKSELARKDHMFTLYLVKHHWQINRAMKLCDVHQFTFWSFSPDHMALEKGRPRTTRYNTANSRIFFVESDAAVDFF